jgi:hypothetical protein
MNGHEHGRRRAGACGGERRCGDENAPRHAGLRSIVIILVWSGAADGAPYAGPLKNVGTDADAAA